MGAQALFLPPQWGATEQPSPCGSTPALLRASTSTHRSAPQPGSCTNPPTPIFSWGTPYFHCLTPTSFSPTQSPHIGSAPHGCVLRPPLLCPSRPGPAQHPLTPGTPPLHPVSDSRTAGSAQQVKFPSDR